MSEGSTVSTTSGPGGGFSLEVESGTHWLSARKAELAGRLAAAVAVGPGATRSGLVLALTAGAQIAGRVTARTDDSPILNARIAVRRMDGEPVAGATSDAEGNYAVEGLAAGAYDVVVSASGYSRLWETGIGLMAAGRFTHDVALGRAASIEGTISSADGRPVAGALIAVLESDFPVAQTFRARSDASGRFHLDGLDEGSVEVNAFREATGDCAFRAVELAAGETAEADLVFDLKGVIKGKVAGSDGAPPGRPAVVEASMLGAMDSQPLAKTPVARDGSYRLEVPAQLQAVAAHWADEEWDPKSPAAMVEVKAGETAQCDLVISDGARQLVVDGVVLEPGRVPARGAKVTVVSDSGSAWSATSDADGRFEVREEGTVSKRPLSVRAQKGGRVVEVKGVRAGARNLVLALKPGATLRGNVVSREPVDGFTLRLLSAADVLQEADGTSFEQELRFEGSSFEVDDLPSVQMSVTASDDENRAGQVVVELKAGEVTRADLVLGPLARVAGRLVLASGRSPSQGGVSAVRKDGSHGGDGEVGPEGRFSIDDLAAGSYDLLAVAPREGQSLTRGFSVAAGQVLDLGDVVLEDERPDPGRIGVTLVDQELGVFVDHVIAGSPAARAGIREGDLIVAVDGVLVESAEEVVARAPGTPGTPVSITVGRDGAEQVLQMERAR